MYCDDWKPSLSPQLLKKIRERKKAEAAEAKAIERARKQAETEEESVEKNRLNEARASRHGKVALTDKINARIKAMKGVPNDDMSVKGIIEMVAANHNMTYDQLITLKFRKHVKARYDAIETVHRLKPGLSSSQLGRFFNRDHTTILYALGRVKGGKGKKS